MQQPPRHLRNEFHFATDSPGTRALLKSHWGRSCPHEAASQPLSQADLCQLPAGLSASESGWFSKTRTKNRSVDPGSTLEAQAFSLSVIWGLGPQFPEHLQLEARQPRPWASPHEGCTALGGAGGRGASAEQQLWTWARGEATHRVRGQFVGERSCQTGKHILSPSFQPSADSTAWLGCSDLCFQLRLKPEEMKAYQGLECVLCASSVSVSRQALRGAAQGARKGAASLLPQGV